jgi:hypothetical protein
VRAGLVARALRPFAGCDPMKTSFAGKAAAWKIGRGGAYPLDAAAIVRRQHAKAFKVIAEHRLQLSSTIIWGSPFPREWR